MKRSACCRLNREFTLCLVLPKRQVVCDVVAQAVSRGQARLVLLAWDLSDNSYRRFWQHQLGEQAANRKMQVWRFGTKQQLGQAVGKPPRGIWALQDENFCRGILGKLQQLQSVAPNVASPAEK